MARVTHHVAVATRKVLARMRGVIFRGLHRFVVCRGLGGLRLDGVCRLGGLGGRRRARIARGLSGKSRAGDQACRDERGGKFRQYRVLLVLRRDEEAAPTFEETFTACPLNAP